MNKTLLFLTLIILFPLQLKSQDLYELKVGNKYGVADSKGNIICAVEYEFVEVRENFILLNKGGKGKYNFEAEGGKWAFADFKGKLLTDFEYENSYGFQGDFTPTKKDGKWGLLDSNLKVLIPFMYEDFEANEYWRDSGVWKVKMNGAWGVINLKNSFIILPQYDRIYKMKGMEDAFVVFTESEESKEYKDDEYYEPSGIYGLTYPYEQWIVQQKFAGISSEVEQNMIRVSSNSNDFMDGNGVGFIDTLGNIILQPKYHNFKEFSEGLIAVAKDWKEWGFMDKKGNLAIKTKFLDVENFKDGLALVQDTSYKYGWIDKQGNWVIEPKFVIASDFSEDLAMVGVDFGTLSKEKLEEGWYSSYSIRLNENIKRGYINKDGKKVMPPIFFVAEDFQNGTALVSNTFRITSGFRYYVSVKHKLPNGQIANLSPRSKTGYGVVDKNGSLLIPTIYESIRQISDSLFIVYDVVDYGVRNIKNEEIIPTVYSELSLIGENLLAYNNISKHEYEKGRFKSTKGKVGLMDLQQNILTDMVFEKLEIPYYKDKTLIIVKQNGKYGLIDRKGN